MHDYFDVLGVPVTAPVSEIRRATARRVHRAHPDFRPSAPARSTPPSFSPADVDAAPVDAAIDFVAVASLVERMESAFFADAE